MEQYDLDPQVKEVIDKIEEIGKALRTDAISKSFSPRAEYLKMLDIATGCYMFLAPEYKRYRAIKENNEVAKYVTLKNEQITKFVSASAEREASTFVSKERYIRDVLEGWLMAAEQAIYTLKKHLGDDKKEESLS